MPRVDTPQVLKILGDAAEFTKRMGFEAEAEALAEFSERFEREKPTLKVLRGPVQEAKDNAARRILDEVLYDEQRRVRPEKSAEHDEFHQIWKAFWDILYPPTRLPVEIKGLVPGNDSSTSVLGDVAEARKIAECALQVTKRFSDAVIRGDIETAYRLCADELQNRRNIKRFVVELEKADGQFGGKPIEYLPQNITWIYADAACRMESNKEGDWPKETPKASKRALVGGWWTDQKTSEGDFGRSVFFWVTEEADGYRIAKFDQYHQ